MQHLTGCNHSVTVKVDWIRAMATVCGSGGRGVGVRLQEVYQVDLIGRG